MTAERARDAQAARAAAAALLARRDFASRALGLKLEQQGFEAAIVASTLAELIKTRALDDRRYAGNFLSYHAGRGHGPLRIGADLRALGIPAELIGEVLDSGPDWHDLARQVRSRRFGPAAATDWPQKARQARFLQYRGFSSDHIRAALGADCDPDSST